MEYEEDLIVDERVSLKPNRLKQILNFFKGMVDSKVTIFIAFLVITSSVGFMEVKPFGLIMLACASIFNIPLMIPLVGTIISYLIFKTDISLYVNYGVLFITYSILSSVIDIEGYSKKLVVSIKLAISGVISGIVTCLVFKDYSIVQAITNVLLTIAIFPVFTAGFSMLFNITKKIVFSKEEIISLAVLTSILLIPFSSINILGFNISNVLIMTVIMVIAWKNDWLIGTSTGVIVGLMYTIATSQSSLIITMYAFSGFIAGVLSRYNKFIVCIAFIVGNMILSYIYTTDIIVWSRFAELIVASIIILVLPRKIILKLEDLFGTQNGLKRGYEHLLGESREIKERLNAMSEVFDNLAHITTPVTEETVEETKNVIKKYLLDYQKTECISCNNLSYCLKEDIDIVSEHIAKRLEENKSIVKEMLPIKCDLAQELIENISAIYSNIKLMRIVKEKENESNKKLAEEYKAISGLIKNIVRDENKPMRQETKEQKRIREELKYMGYVVYEDSYNNIETDSYYEFITDILIDIDKAKREIQRIVSDIMGKKMSIKLVLNSSKTERSRIKLVPSSKYILKAIVKQVRKADSSISGDSYIVTELKDNSKIIAISDGMGSGEKSKEVSETVISMIEKMGKWF